MTKHTVTRFQSIDEFVAATPTLNNTWYSKYSSHWDSIRSYTQKGMPDILARAESLMDSLDNVSLESHAFVHSPDVWGQRLAMGEWLAGSPTCFRRKKRTVVEAAPMNVYASLFGSAGISTESLINRGTAILALVMKLTQVRPVDLWLTMETRNGNHRNGITLAIRVETRPLNLSQASFCIGHPMFMRCLVNMHLKTFLGAGNTIPTPYDKGDKEQELPGYLNALGVTDQDLYIPGSILWDTPTIENPVEWINSQLVKYANVGEE